MKTFDEIWEQIHIEQEWGKYPSEEVIRFVARNFYKHDRAKTRILDAGCGTGAISWYLAREGYTVYAFDGSETAIVKAEKRIKDEGLCVKFCVLDAANTKFEDNYFDGIIDSAMIYANRVDNIKMILSECYRVLKPNGKFFSTGLFKTKMTGFGTGQELEKGTYREVTEGALAHRGTVHFFEYEELNELWNSAGFKNIKIDSLERTDNGGLNSVSYYMVSCEKW